jgi:hypothetical protein
MVSLAKLFRIRQGMRKKYKNMGLEKFRLPIRGKNCIICPIYQKIRNFDKFPIKFLIGQANESMMQ